MSGVLLVLGFAALGVFLGLCFAAYLGRKRPPPPS
jgi:hypothetical protein